MPTKVIFAYFNAIMKNIYNLLKENMKKEARLILSTTDVSHQSYAYVGKRVLEFELWN